MGCVVNQMPNNQTIPFVICFERQLSAHQTVEQGFHHCSGFIRNAYRQIKFAFFFK